MTSGDGQRLLVVQVAPLLGVRQLGDRVFDYLVPERLAGRVRPGAVVSVPLGRRSVRGVVVGLGPSESLGPDELRPILDVGRESVPEELLSLAREVAARYLASYGACLRLVAPPSVSLKQEKRGNRKLRVRLADQALLAELEAGSVAGVTPKQRSLLAVIGAQGGRVKEICRAAGVSPAVLVALRRKGLVEIVPEEDEEGESGEAWSGRSSLEGGVSPGADSGAADWPPLWPEQEAAVQDLIAAYEQPGFSRKLLWGITGSGKTEVYLRVIARVLRDGAGAILLVPEIALTPQMIDRVRSRFGSCVGVFHSALPPAERYREYRRIARGEASVVVGARSAVFAPVPNLRLVILDESHDSSYKQEEEPRYHARTVAELRLARSGGLLLEGSATPPVESVVQVSDPLRLTRRAAGVRPVCEIVDMRTQGGSALLAPVSRAALLEVLRDKKQAIILLNRRGYAGYVHCETCGHVMTCAQCELSLTYHSAARRLVCHGCGRIYAEPAVCPACKGAPLTRAAPGTERLDRELRALVPGEQVFRLDSDVVTSGTRVRTVLKAFAEARPGVLVGTQMVAKGHDFPYVTLVIVADADVGLYVPDFRAAERTFQLLAQVAGRAGRAEHPGRVLVQTWNPDAPCIRMALQPDQTSFYHLEIGVRRRLGYPPYAELIRLVITAREAKRAELGARFLAERLAPHFAFGEVRGPARLPMLRGRERWHVLICAGDGKRARAVVERALAGLEAPYRKRGVTLTVDVDPQSFT